MSSATTAARPALSFTHTASPIAAPPLSGVAAFIGSASRELSESVLESAVSAASAEHPASHLGRSLRGYRDNGGRVCVRIPAVNTEDDFRAAIERMTEFEEIDLVCLPDVSRLGPDAAARVQQAVLEACAKSGDRVAVLDPVGTGATDQSRGGLRSADLRLPPLICQSGRAVRYDSWLTVPDGRGGTDVVPASGHIAGVIARLDREFGSHAAPANVELEGANGFVTAELYDNTLDDLRTNPIQSFPGGGIRPMGTRTMMPTTSDWAQLPVRRTFDGIVKRLHAHFLNVPFEANNVSLWIALSREIDHVLMSFFELGAFKGATPEDSFWFRCDESTNPQQLRDLGIVSADIGVALVEPTSMINVRLRAGPDGVDIVALTAAS